MSKDSLKKNAKRKSIVVDGIMKIYLPNLATLRDAEVRTSTTGENELL